MDYNGVWKFSIKNLMKYDFQIFFSYGRGFSEIKFWEHLHMKDMSKKNKPLYLFTNYPFISFLQENSGFWYGFEILLNYYITGEASSTRCARAEAWWFLGWHSSMAQASLLQPQWQTSALGFAVLQSTWHISTMYPCSRTLPHEHMKDKWTYIALQELISCYVAQCLNELDS